MFLLDSGSWAVPFARSSGRSGTMGRLGLQSLRSQSIQNGGVPGGERKRWAITLEIMNEPKLLLLLASKHLSFSPLLGTWSRLYITLIWNHQPDCASGNCDWCGCASLSWNFSQIIKTSKTSKCFWKIADPLNDYFPINYHSWLENPPIWRCISYWKFGEFPAEVASGDRAYHIAYEVERGGSEEEELCVLGRAQGFPTKGTWRTWKWKKNGIVHR